MRRRAGFGLIEELTGSMKNSVLSLILFFVVGLFWLVKANRKTKLMLARDNK